MFSSATLDVSGLTTADAEYRIATTKADREAAFRLVYKSYLSAGLGERNRWGMRVTPYHLLPTTEVFVAKLASEVIFSLTLVIDGKLGLPMESVFRDEVEQRRADGLVMAEVSCLADRRLGFRASFPVFVRLCRLMAQYAWRQNVDELMVAVHPRHARFYRRFMHFQVIGAEKSYPTAANAPALALSLNFDWVDQTRPAAFDTFFGEWLPDDQVEGQPIPDEQRAYFERMIDPAFDAALPAGIACDPSSRFADLPALCP